MYLLENLRPNKKNDRKCGLRYFFKVGIIYYYSPWDQVHSTPIDTTTTSDIKILNHLGMETQLNVKSVNVYPHGNGISCVLK